MDNIYTQKAIGIRPPLDGKTHPHYEFPVHLYHATLDPVVANEQGALDQALADGYGFEYIHRDYPKMVTVGEDKHGNPIQKKVANAEEHAALKSQPALPPLPTFAVDTNGPITASSSPVVGIDPLD